MKEKLKCILLIDDDEPTNFLNEWVIKEANCAEQVISVQSGKAALDYIAAKAEAGKPLPELIFLDINMPAMSGWEFLDKYREIASAAKGETVMIMLTTSINPADVEKAKKLDSIRDFQSKPLTLEALNELLHAHFPGRVK